MVAAMYETSELRPPAILRQRATQMSASKMDPQFHSWVHSVLHVESLGATTGGRRFTRKPVILRRGLPDVDARNRARDDQALNFRSPLEDRVGIRAMCNLPNQRLFLRRLDPGMNDKWVI